MRYFIRYIPLVIFILLSSCKKRECLEPKTAFVTHVNAPETAEVDKPMPIDVSFVVGNGCGHFGRFFEIVQGKTRIIEVIAIYEGCGCATIAPVLATEYVFKPTEKGANVLYFRSGENEFMVVNLQVD